MWFQVDSVCRMAERLAGRGEEQPWGYPVKISSLALCSP